VNVRAAVPEDAAGVAEVNVASWHAAYRGIMPDAVLDGLDVADFTVGWGQRIVAVPGSLLVCEADGRIVGFAGSGATRDDDCDSQRTAEVYTIYVAPEWWRTGAGRALWNATLDRLRAAGFAEVVVWVLTENAGARAFYERMGLRLDEGAAKHFEAAPGLRLQEARYRTPL